jgi:hypothetical protein
LSNTRIHVAKIAPEQPVQEQLISAGLRFDSGGHLLPYSILGSVNDYAAELSDMEAAEVGETKIEDSTRFPPFSSLRKVKEKNLRKTFLKLEPMIRTINVQLVVPMVVDGHYIIGNFEWMNDDM